MDELIKDCHCLTLPLLLMQIVIFLLTCAVIVAQDYSLEKNKLDVDKKRFKFRIHYWPFRNDDIIKRLLFGSLGALLASEIGLWAIKAFTNIPESMHENIDLTLIAVSTYFAPKIFIK